MSILKKYNIRKIVFSILWIGIAIGCVALLISAIHIRNQQLCKGVEIEIDGTSNNFFISKQDVIDIIEKSINSKIAGQSVSKFNLVSIEKELKKDVWISKVELFFDNNSMLKVEIEEREPIVRIFTKGGQSFYIDNTIKVLPLSDKYAARLPIFTNFPSEAVALTKADSNLLKDIKSIGLCIQKDSFLMAMIDQININEAHLFELVPKMGDQLILFGDANDREQKFNKLKLFYKKVTPIEGWSKYSVINLQYKDQVVAKIKGMEDILADSMRTLQIMQAIALNSAKKANDSTQTILQDNDQNSTNISLILESLQRDEQTDSTVAVEKPIVQLKQSAPVVNKVSDKKISNKTSTAKPAVKIEKKNSKPINNKSTVIKKSTNNNEYK